MCLWWGGWGGSYEVAAAEGFTEGREESGKPRWPQGFLTSPSHPGVCIPRSFTVSFQPKPPFFFFFFAVMSFMCRI